MIDRAVYASLFFIIWHEEEMENKLKVVINLEDYLKKKQKKIICSN